MVRNIDTSRVLKINKNIYGTYKKKKNKICKS